MILKTIPDLMQALVDGLPKSNSVASAMFIDVLPGVALAVAIGELGGAGGTSKAAGIKHESASFIDRVLLVEPLNKCVRSFSCKDVPHKVHVVVDSSYPVFRPFFSLSYS